MAHKVSVANYSASYFSSKTATHTHINECDLLFSCKTLQASGSQWIIVADPSFRIQFKYNLSGTHSLSSISEYTSYSILTFGLIVIISGYIVRYETLDSRENGLIISLS